MTSSEALRVLVELIVAAQGRGALSLQEAAAGWAAIQIFQPDNLKSSDLVTDNQPSPPDNQPSPPSDQDILVD